MSDSINERTNTNVDLISTPEKLDRVANLIAEGEFPFPTDIPPDQQTILAAEVRKRRHQRLVKFICRLIAKELHQPKSPLKGGTKNEKIQIRSSIPVQGRDLFENE
ncbi:hypothetical protein [uncultured Gimesia sp.]|uniref:hypothetical protein n=1 Tax=uncultured Gimesia sp. TaxID=1678688 RepID=UPI0030DC750A|tara:strand:+ start:2109 stop:2426 length:318 start_codon:yes stop_codon:yes gene_type:complete